MGDGKPALESNEDKLIARFFTPLATHPGALGLTDDAAFLTPPAGHDLVLKTDAIVGGVHFLPDDPPADIARKALRVNLSDLAAKGARPLGCLLSLAIPGTTGEEWLQAFSEGLRVDCEQFRVPLFGGDTDRTPGPVTVAMFVLGSVPAGTMVRRTGARPGDRVLVTGTIGDAVLGLRLFRDNTLASAWKTEPGDADHLRGRYRLPRPRLGLAEVLRTHASAAMDVSDGLAGDLAKLCRVSGVSAAIGVERVPLSAGGQAAVAAEPGLIEAMLSGGDDYEILCSVAPDRLTSFKAAADMAGISVADIGEIVSGTSVPIFRDKSGRTIHFARTSYSHF